MARHVAADGINYPVPGDLGQQQGRSNSFAAGFLGRLGQRVFRQRKDETGQLFHAGAKVMKRSGRGN
jgi:hypothetical protein